MNGPRANPPHIGQIPMTLEHLYRWALDMAYIAPPRERRNAPDI